MTINFAICEDEFPLADYMKSLVYTWTDEKNVSSDVKIFENAEQFKNQLNKNAATFDVLLLDIMMDGQNGMDLAAELRQKGHSMVIIFVTATPDYMNRGYDVSAFHYLLKPIDEPKFYATLERAYTKLSLPEEVLMVSADGRDYRIPFSEIICIEALRNSILIETTNGRYEVRQNISKTEPLLGKGFFRCQRSFIIHLAFVKHISKTNVQMDGGKIISISRGIYETLYKAFIAYFKGVERW